MSNGSEVCCVLGVCCPPAQARERLERELAARLSQSGDCTAAVDWLFDTFDFAPKGTLKPLKDAFVQMARSHHKE